MESKGGKFKLGENKKVGENKIKPSEESLGMVLLRYGIDPNRIKDFIDNNIETSREISELKKTAGSRKEYCKEQLVINEAAILRILLEE